MGGNRKKSNGTCVAEEIDRCKKKGTITFFPSELFNVFCFGSILFFLTFRKRQVLPLAVPLTQKGSIFFLQFLLRMQGFDVAFTIQIRFGRKCSYSKVCFALLLHKTPPHKKNTLPQTGSKQPESPTTCAAVFLAWHPAD